MSPGPKYAARIASPAAVAATMARVARAALADVRTILQARHAIAPHLHTRPGATVADGPATVAALGAWARTVRPIREPADFGELIQAPWRTAATMLGDCDDTAAAVAAFARVLGHPARVAVVTSSGAGPGFAHAAAIVHVDPYDDARAPRSRAFAIDQSGAHRLADYPESILAAEPI